MVGAKRIHWEIDDPAKVQGSEEEIAKVFRFVIKLILSTADIFQIKMEVKR